MRPPVTVTVLSHRGLVRSHNEDAVGICGWALQGDTPAVLHLPLPAGPARLAVCDGMGGHRGGAHAARFAAARTTAADARPVEALIQDTSAALVDVSDADPSLTGLGCTIVGIGLDHHGEAVVFHVGDSSAHLIDGDVVAPLTRPDRRTLDAPSLTQALGGGRHQVLDVHMTKLALRPGRSVLLCSDGLTDLCPPENWPHLLAADPIHTVQSLVSQALRAGGHDNVTVVLLRVLGEPADALPPDIGDSGF